MTDKVDNAYKLFKILKKLDAISGPTHKKAQALLAEPKDTQRFDWNLREYIHLVMDRVGLQSVSRVNPAGTLTVPQCYIGQRDAFGDTIVDIGWYEVVRKSDTQTWDRDIVWKNVVFLRWTREFGPTATEMHECIRFLAEYVYHHKPELFKPEDRETREQILQKG